MFCGCNNRKMISTTAKRLHGYWIAYRPLILILSQLFSTMGVYGRSHPTEMSNRVITTHYGKLRGMLITLPNPKLSKVEAYYGLTYASTINGELRFMPPTSPMEKWSGIKVAIEDKPACPQKLPDIEEMKKTMPHGRVNHFARILPFLRDQAEECLNLNIYVPSTANESRSFPVVLFIHAESYETGTGNAYDGSVLAAYGDVIVVTMNFRLGVLGFLTTGDSNAPGNYATLDQVAALHWLRENVAAFGGNPNLITLMGQGYGAAMVNLLLVSPVTKGKNLFKRAIMQSGSALGMWALSGDPLRLKNQLAQQVNCSEHLKNTEMLLKCLKRVPYQDLVNVKISAPKFYSLFGPVIDKRSVLPEDVKTLLDQNRSVFNEVDILLGMMKSEGFLFFHQDEITEGISEFRKSQILRTYVRNVYSYHRQKIYDILWHQYSEYDQTENPSLLRDEAIELVGDGQFVAPVIDLADHHHSKTKGTYLYSFSYPSRSDAYPRWAGGVHGDDLMYVFGAPLVDGVDPFGTSYTQSEQMLSEAVMTYWTNFIKTGDPNRPNKQAATVVDKRNRFDGLEWPKYNAESQEYLSIAENTGSLGMRPSVRHHYKGSNMALWLDLIPKFHKSDDLDIKYHLLDNYNNKSTFESVGTRKLNYKKMIIPPPLTPPAPPSTVTTTLKPTTTLPYVELIPTTVKYRRTIKPVPTRPSRGGNSNNKDENNSPDNAQKSDLDSDESSSLSESRLSLSVTVAVGSALVFLNIIIFAAVYYQRDKMRQERKARDMEMNKEQSMRMIGDHDNMKSSTGPDSESDGGSSLGGGPPSPPPPQTHTLPRQTAVHTQVTTLPMQSRSPIPVTPPKAPYNTLPNHTGMGTGGQYSQQHINSNHTNNHNTYHAVPLPRSPRSGHLHHRGGAGGAADYNVGGVDNNPPHYQNEHSVQRRMLRRSSSVDSGTENHHGNPSTVV